MNKSSKWKISIFQRKNLQNHIPKEKSPMNKSSIKISKTSMEKSLRINLQGKISMNKSSLKFFQKFNLQNKSSRKNLHEQIFERKNLHFQRKNLQNHIPKEKSPWTNLLKNFQKFNGKISRINLQGKISMNKSSKGKISRKNLQWINLH